MEGHLEETLQQIEEIQDSIDRLNEQASDEILLVEQRFIKERQPFYLQRADLIKEVPGFWAAVLVNHGRISELVTEQDEEALQYLTRLDVKEFDDIKSGYKIDCHFDENPFFTNKCLTKEYHLSESGELVSKSTVISWKQGKRLVPPSSSSVKTNQKRPHEAETFFRWFVDGNGLDYSGDEIGEIIKDDIWPNPVQYFMAEENFTFDSEGDTSANQTGNTEGSDDEEFDEDEEEDEKEDD